MKRFTVWAARAGCVVIAAVTFLTSFDAISDVATATGAVSPSLAWAVPLAVDGMILVGSAVAWTEAIEGRWHPFPLTVVAGAAVLSVWANVAHAPGANMLGQTLAAVPPIALIVSVELAAWQVRQAIKRSHASERESAAHKRISGSMGRPGGGALDATGTAVTASEFHVDLWDRIVAYVNQAEEPPTLRVLAEALGTTPEIVRQAIEAQRDRWDWLARPDNDSDAPAETLASAAEQAAGVPAGEGREPVASR